MSLRRRSRQSDNDGGDVNISKPLPRMAGGDGGFHVLKEGFLLKTKRLKTITSIKQRWFSLKRSRETGQCILEYYDGKVLRGSVDLKQSKTIPRPGSAHFEIRTPGRVYYLAAEHDNVYQAVSWVQVLQRLTPGRRPRPRPAKSQQQEDEQHRQQSKKGRQMVYYEMGDELIPLMMNPKTKRVRQATKRRGNTLRDVFHDTTTTTTTTDDDDTMNTQLPAASASTASSSLSRHRQSVRLIPIREAPSPPTAKGAGVGGGSQGASAEERAGDVEGNEEAAESGTAATMHEDNEQQGGEEVAAEKRQRTDEANAHVTSVHDNDQEEEEAAEATAATLRRLQRSTLRHSWPLLDVGNEDDAAETESRAQDEAAAQASSSGVERTAKSICLFRLTDLEWKKQLGEGFFGRVFKAVHKRTGAAVVVKELKESDNAARAAFVAEMSLLKALHHRNVLQFMGIFCKDDKLHLLTEYVGGGSLDCIIQNKTGQHPDLPWRRRMRIALDIAAGMAYLHSVKVIHRDLKSENCLIRQDGTAVVADFGLARVMEGEVMAAGTLPRHGSGLRRQTMAMTTPHAWSAMRPRSMTVVGTPYFMAPELLLGMDYNESVDVFSFGILLCELIGRIAADPDIMPRTNAFGINETVFRRKWGEGCPDRLLTIAFTCAHTKAKKRPLFHVVHHWLNVLLLNHDTIRKPIADDGAPAASVFTA